MNLTKLQRKFCVAPMMDKTNRHFRYLLRGISKYALLYTEMITPGAILHGNQNAFLDFDKSEHPLALQLGGSDPIELGECADIAKKRFFDELNLNVGCPSNRVQKGQFGACLMEKPQVVAACIRSMQKYSIPVTVKCRLGTENFNSYENFKYFIDVVSQESECKIFIVHARLAYLNGFSPKQNRDIPPLNYSFVYKLKQQKPDLQIILNGGIDNLEDAENHLNYVDGVMLGRTICKNPWILSDVDEKFYNKQQKKISRIDVANNYLNYMKKFVDEGVSLPFLLRQLLSLFQGCRGSKYWRNFLSNTINEVEVTPNMIREALGFIKVE